MASVAMPRALVAGDLGLLRAIAEETITLPSMAVTWAPSATSIPRSLAAAGEADLLEQLKRKLEERGRRPRGTVAFMVAQGLLARLESRDQEALVSLTAAENETRLLGRRYEAACLALEVAHVHLARGDSAAATDATRRANEVLVPLGCVHPY